MNLDFTESNVQGDDCLRLFAHCREFCVAVCVNVDHDLMFKSAQRRLTITHTLFELYKERQTNKTSMR